VLFKVLGKRCRLDRYKALSCFAPFDMCVSLVIFCSISSRDRWHVRLVACGTCKKYVTVKNVHNYSYTVVFGSEHIAQSSQ
jgi:hypothetical protein